MQQQNNIQDLEYVYKPATGIQMYGSIENTDDLATAIKKLEQKRMLMENDMKDQFQDVLESFKPANILKNTLHEVQESMPLKHNLLKIALGLGVGYFSRKLVVGKSAGIVKKVLGTALQFGMTKLVAGKNEEVDGNGIESETKKKGLLRRILSL